MPDRVSAQRGIDDRDATHTSSQYRRVWWIFLLVCLGAAVGYQLLPSGIGRDTIYQAFGLASAAAIVAGVRLHQPVARSGWYLMAVGQLAWSVADAIFSWIADVQHQDRFPTVADGFYLAGYPLVAVGLVVLIRARRPFGDLGGLLDSAILTIGLGLLVWVLLAKPTIENYQDSWVAAAVAAAYPVGDILLLGLLVQIVVTPGVRTASLRLLIAATLVLITVDLAASAMDLLTFASTNSINFLWLASYALWGGAALHPSMRALSESTTGANIEFTRKRLAALTVAVLAAPSILVVQHLLAVSLDIWAIAIGSFAMFLLVSGRMKLAIDQISAANRERVQAQAALAHQATHDPLTGLPNRAQAVWLLAEALRGARRTDDGVGLLFIDLDGFKHVNDSLGHGAGDELLRVLASRLRANVRAGDSACRLGGDEFVVLLQSITPTDAVEVGNRLVAVLSEPVVLAGNRPVIVGASIGVAFSQPGVTDPDVLLQEADAAVYRAKRSGRGRVEVFDTHMRRELRARTELERDLSAAIENDRLVLHYQPIVHLASGAVQGYEALIRWPRNGAMMSPLEFIPIAEQSELICQLGAWVLRRATEQLARWNQHRGDRSLTVAVNISGRHISRPRVLVDVRTAVVAAEIDPAQLVLEITETALTDGSLAISNLAELRHDGVAVSIDDFGTGYSSIARLENLPIDILKVDQRFLDRSTRSAEKLLRMIVQTGHALGLGVIAEGVEAEEQADLLRSIGCDSAQGFHLGRPLDPSAIDPQQGVEPPELVARGSSRDR